MRMFHTLSRFWGDERGISSVEYALILAVVAGAISVAAGALGEAVGNEIGLAADCVGDSDVCDQL